ncbi:hypothetical protein HDV00_012142 [Rhizophlyctis rosea]|nr:hypothetical protein HDV00_012142 [Rhizophlyctis rosea]
MPPKIPLPSPSSRLSILSSLRTRILPPPPSITSTIPSRAHQILSYYPPDIDLLALSSQDPLLKPLNLKDVWLESELKREKALAERGKICRVSALTGKRFDHKNRPAKEKGKKRRK